MPWLSRPLPTCWCFEPVAGRGLPVSIFSSVAHIGALSRTQITSPDPASHSCKRVSDSLLGLHRWPVMFVGGFESSQHHVPARRRVGLGPVAAAARGNGAAALGRQKVRHQRAVGVTRTRKLLLSVCCTRHWVFCSKAEAQRRPAQRLEVAALTQRARPGHNHSSMVGLQAMSSTSAGPNDPGLATVSHRAQTTLRQNLRNCAVNAAPLR